MRRTVKMAAILFMLCTIGTTPVYAQNGEDIVKGIMGMMFKKMGKKMKQSNPAATQSSNCNGPFGSHDAPDIPICVQKCCGGFLMAQNAQDALKSLGYYHGSIDGDFGAGTQKAVKAWERDNSNTVKDGAISNREYLLLVKQGREEDSKVVHYKEGMTTPDPDHIPDEIYGVHWSDNGGWPGRNCAGNPACDSPCAATINLKASIVLNWDELPKAREEHYQNWGACVQAVKDSIAKKKADRITAEKQKAAKKSSKDQVKAIIEDEFRKFKENGHPVSDHSPTTAIRAAIKGDSSALQKGHYYAGETQLVDAYVSVVRVAGSNYKISQILGDHVLYQNSKRGYPPILLEKEGGKLYLQGQSLHLAGFMYEYLGETSYESITGAPVQALIFRPIYSKRIEDALDAMDKK